MSGAGESDAQSETSDVSDLSDVLGRADALLNKHRVATQPVADPAAVPVLTEAIVDGLDAAAIPTLTDVVVTPADAGIALAAPAVRMPLAEPAHGGEIISRVQAQNLEHGV